MAETNEKLKVKRGKSDALPTEVESGSLIFETDTGTAYVDADTERIQIKDPTKLPLTGGNLTGTLDMGGHTITSSHTPTEDNDIANKAYVDANIKTYTGIEPIIVTNNDEITHKEYDEVQAGPDEDTELNYGDKFIIPHLESDEYGHVTSGSDKEFTLPDVPESVSHADTADEATHATTSDSATTAETASEADHAATSDTATKADTATSAEEATHAVSADTATTAETAAEAEHSKEADHADSADTATSADTAKEADHATSADTAIMADTATEANHASSADTATSATTAETASEASHATEADHATSADTASSADEATHATSADTATTADSATEADHALTADSATNADEATHATSSDTATEADHTLEADHASESDHATSADTATTAESVDKLNEAQTIDGVSFDGTETVNHYGICDTDADEASKTVSCDNFVLTEGAIIYVSFVNTNTADNPTLNVNDTGEQSIVFQNEDVATTGLIADTVYEFVYDGTNYNIVSGSLNRVDNVEDDNATFRNIIIIDEDEDPNTLDVPVGSIILQRTNELTAESPILLSDNVISHKTATSINVGPTANQTLDFGGTFTVPYISSDDYGHVSGGGNRTYTLPDASSGGSSYYGTCSTASGTVAKTVSCDGFELDTGVTIQILFENGNSASNPTLNVNSTGAKNITYQNSNIEPFAIALNTIYTFTYNGTSYEMVSSPAYRTDGVEDEDNEFRNITVIESDASINDVDASTGSIIMKKVPSGISKVYWGTCTTASGTATKTVACEGFELKDGATIHVYFTNENTASSPKLNVDGTGALDISANGSQITSDTFIADTIYEFVYYNSKYYMIGGEDLSDTINDIYNKLEKLISTSD